MQTIFAVLKRHRKPYIIIVAITVLFLLVRVVPLFQSREPVLLSENNLELYKDARSYYFPDIVLDRGIYSVQIESDTQEDLEFSIDGYAEGSWQRLSGMIPETIVEVPAGRNTTEQRIIVRGNKSPCNLRLLKHASGEDVLKEPLSVSVIYRPLQSVFAYTFYTLAPFGCVIGFLLLFFHYADRNDRRGEWMIIAYSLILLILCIPVLKYNVPNGDDTGFHIYRIASMAREFARGQIPARIGSEWFSGYGNPVHMFYGELMLFIPSLLYMGGVPSWQCFVFAVFLVNLMLLVFSHICFCELGGNRTTGFCCAVIYATSHRYFFNLYPRGAFGEATAMAFFPLIILGFYRLFSDEQERIPRCILPLVIGFTGLIQSHVVSLVQAVFFSMVLCLIKIRELLQKKRVHTLLFSAVCTGLLNLWFLLPFMDYYLRYDLEGGKVTSIIRDSCAEPVTLLTGGDHASLGLSVVFLFVFGAYCIFRMSPSKKRNGLILMASVSIAAAVMSTRWMPWHWLELNINPLYGLIGGKIEFATRYTSPCVAMICAFGAMSFNAMEELLPDVKKTVYLMLTVAASWSFIQYYGVACAFDAYDTAFLSAATDPVITDASEPSYIRTGLDWWKYIRKEETDGVCIRKADGTTLPVDTTRDGLTFVCDIENPAKEPVEVDFPVWNFHGFIAEDGTQRFPVTDGENLCVRVTVPGDYQGTVTVRFSEPWYWRVAELVSVVSLFVFVLWYNKRSGGRARGEKS